MGETRHTKITIRQKCKFLERDRNKELRWIQRQREDVLCNISKKVFMEDVNLGIILRGRSLERQKCIPGRGGIINKSGIRKHRFCNMYTSLVGGQAFVINYWKMRLENWLDLVCGISEYQREWVVVKVCKCYF